MKQTNLIKYGVERPAQNKEVYDKARKTNLEKYGVEYPFQSEEIKEKSKKTNIERYGVENPSQNKEIKEKSKKTNIERYGVENPQQNKCVKEKTKLTNIVKYGCESHNKKRLLEILPQIEDKYWLFNQYVTLNKSALQIAQEFGIDGSTILAYLRKHEIEIHYNIGHSKKCIQWLESIMQTNNIFIQHAMNGGEYSIPGTRFKVDGYCKETNTIYEFHGDIFHGNPDLFEDTDTPNFYNKNITAKELYNKTIERENKIKELGFNLVVIWENEFDGLFFT